MKWIDEINSDSSEYLGTEKMFLLLPSISTQINTRGLVILHILPLSDINPMFFFCSFHRLLQLL